MNALGSVSFLNSLILIIDLSVFFIFIDKCHMFIFAYVTLTSMCQKTLFLGISREYVCFQRMTGAKNQLSFLMCERQFQNL